MSATLTKERVKAVIDDVDATLDHLGDGAYWGVIAERLGVEVWEAQEFVSDNADYFGYGEP